MTACSQSGLLTSLCECNNSEMKRSGIELLSRGADGRRSEAESSCWRKERTAGEAESSCCREERTAEEAGAESSCCREERMKGEN